MDRIGWFSPAARMQAKTESSAVAAQILISARSSSARVTRAEVCLVPDPAGRCRMWNHSHSIVAGGLLEMS
jgi:hypothetical protein